MDTPRLIYFADPMCSWCYGFSPVIQQIRETFGRALPIQVVMGGLRPGTDTPSTDAAKAELKTHWGHVHEATGLPFDGAVLDREGLSRGRRITRALAAELLKEVLASPPDEE